MSKEVTVPTVIHPRVARHQVEFLTRYFQVTGDDEGYRLMRVVLDYMERTRC